MTLPVIAIRPEPGCAASVAGGLAHGLDMHGFPLFEIVPRQWELPSGRFDAVLAGSANAFRHAGPALAALRTLPVHAVGAATAEAARGARFTIASVGSSGLQPLLDALVPPLRLLRLAGEEHVPLTPPPGVSLETRIVYASEPQPMPAELGQLLHGGAVVLLHSATAARHLAAECDRLRLSRAGLRLAALGPRIAAAAGEGWAACRAASAPTEPALLALAADLCHASSGGEGR